MKLKITLSVILLLFCSMLPNCGERRADAPPAPYASYRDVPGVTEEEIAAVETLAAKNPTLIYGMVFGTESFFGKDSSEIRGFTALFCEYLSALFGMNFKPGIFEWDDMIAKFRDGQIDFLGDLTITQELLKDHYMTDPIAVRILNWFRAEDDGGTLKHIVETRRPRYAFLEGTPTLVRGVALSDMGADGEFDTLYVPDYATAYKYLKSGEADAFFDEHTVKAIFEDFGGIASGNVLPLTFSPVSLTARKPELAPIISVVQKMLRNGGRRYLTDMYARGEREFTRQRFEKTLTEEEREYIRLNPVVNVAAEFDNYPISLYNRYEKRFEGVFIDALREVEALTGLTFNIVNPPYTDWPVILKMLESGEAAMASELIRSTKREGRFLWPQTPLLRDNYALLSKSETRNMAINEVLDARVGMFESTAHAELFKLWFPDHVKITEFENVLSAFGALDRGEIDLLMASQNQLLFMTNYMERPGYRINVLFDRTYESFIGFNKDYATLCSVVDKALRQIGLKAISDDWTRKTFDYRVKVAQAQRPWFIGVCVFLGSTIILLFILYKKVRGDELRMEELVRQRTAELNEKTLMLERISMTDQLTGLPNRRSFDMRMDLVWRTAIRNKSPISFLMMDLDKFKAYNDTYGHLQGDTLLRAAAKVIEAAAKRPGDLAVRWGGEEFAALLANTDADGAATIGETIRANMEKMTVITLDGEPTHTTISIGICTLIPHVKSSQDTFISAADDALYKAKEKRNCVEAFQAEAFQAVAG